MSQVTFGQLSFGSSTATTAFGQTSAFGKTTFGQTATPAFGQSSMPTTPAFCGGNNTGSSGFGSFTSQGPAKFGTTGWPRHGKLYNAVTRVDDNGLTSTFCNADDLFRESVSG